MASPRREEGLRGMQISAIGRKSISSVLKVVVDIAWVIACALLGFIWIVALISFFTMANGGDADLGVFSRVSIADPRRLAVWTVIGTVFCIGGMVIASHLRGVFETLIAGDPFVPDNARRLRVIALVLAVMEAARMFLSVLVQVALAVMGVKAGEGENALTLSLNLSVWISVLTLIVLAQVFAEGAAMREEQKMTI
jgi:hypothetical protein